MHIRDDFSSRAVVLPEDYEWVHSPANGVDRMMLDRIGDEVARATTIVRFAPNSYFDAHTHGGGEEYLVLDGVFSDQSGDFAAGSYVRNPIGTSHKPHTDDGCTIFVKLYQFDESDQDQFHIDTGSAAFEPGPSEGISILPLHQTANETVALWRFEPGTKGSSHQHPGGEEILVLEGTLQDELGSYPAGSWIRSPHLSQHTPFSEEGCLFYVKSGHLAPSSAKD
ncbi:cupin domain-containing protein [Hoeflea sp.]|uniref:cupin domain-containing protein n=1 Tax=Hoeflea sp. TaxID=1940281 RepID=UPI003B012B16